MKGQPQISIIIPVYQVEAYLESCVQSVLNQTFGDFELILVDDGSTDGSGEICSRYAAADSRVRHLSRVNGGASAARNTGIDAARGRYIGFVDGDDWIEPDMYALLYENSVSQAAELSACGFVKIADYEAIRFVSPGAPVRCYGPESALRATLRWNHMRYSPCNKLFRRELFQGVRFPENRIMEDKGTLYRLIHQCRRVAWCPAPKYHYFMRPGSIMHHRFDESYLDIFTINEELLAFVDAHYPALKRMAGASYGIECLRLMDRMRDACYNGEAEYRKCRDILRTYGLYGILYPCADGETRWRLLKELVFRRLYRNRDAKRPPNAE